MEQIERLTKAQKRAKRAERKSANDSGLKLANITPMTNNQQDFFNNYDRFDVLVLDGCPGTGKAQPLNAKILTPQGWSEMAKMVVGSEIISADGTVTNVVGVFPQGVIPAYKVTFSDGASTICNIEHLWTGWSSKRRNSRGIYQTLTLGQIQQLIDAGGKFSIPLLKPYEGDDRPLPISPYLLGVLIGDGCLRSIGLMISSADEQIINQCRAEIEQQFPELELVKINNTQYDYRIRYKKRVVGKSRLINSLEELQLLVKSYSKFIPEIYLNSSANQRRRLLQGLMDTDGTVGSPRRKSTVSFSTVSQRLAVDVQQLIRSLGGKAGISTIKTNSDHGVRFDVSCNLLDKTICFSLDRKLQRIQPTQLKQFRRKIVSIEYVGEEEMQCIMVDHPTHLYITDDYIVTHNTFLAMYKALQSLDDDFRCVKVIRSSVTVRDIGFLPGNAKEKMAAFETPYAEICSELYGRGDAYEILKQKKLVEFHPTTHMRGITFSDCVVIIDECQNMTYQELNTLLTRVGENCKVILCGDVYQDDLTNPRYKEQSGYNDVIKILDRTGCSHRTKFEVNDIVRSGFVKQYIKAKIAFETNEPIEMTQIIARVRLVERN